MGTRIYLSEGRAAGLSSCPLASIQCRSWE